MQNSFRKIIALVLVCIFMHTNTSTTLIQSAYAASTVLSVQVNNGPYKAGDTFKAGIVLNGNPGFAGMALKISYPRGLVATSIQPVGVDMMDMFNIIQGLTLPDGWSYGQPLLKPVENHLFAIWGRASNYSTHTATLLEVTFVVTSDADIGVNPITVAFEGAQGARTPVNLNEQPLSIAIINGFVTIQRNLISIIEPSAISNLPNGTAKTASALGLPDVVELNLGVAVDGATVVKSYANVTWDVMGATYNPEMDEAQTFVVNGSVVLPENVMNPNSISLATRITVTVSAGSSSIKWGDINGDGVVNAADSTLLRYNLSLLETNPHLVLPASADVNGDGIVDTEDLALLRRYLGATDPSTVPLGQCATGHVATLIINDDNHNIPMSNNVPLPVPKAFIDRRAENAIRRALGETNDDDCPV